MAWAKVDDQWFAHRKVVGLSLTEANRKRCRGSMDTWASELRPDGTWWAWLVCDDDTRHVTERDSVPAGEQDALPGMNGTDE